MNKTQIIISYDYTPDTRNDLFFLINHNNQAFKFSRVPDSRGTNEVSNTEVLVAVIKEGLSLVAFVDWLERCVKFPARGTVCMWVRFPFEEKFEPYWMPAQ